MNGIMALALGCFSIELAPEHRVANKGGYCTWASLDTVARANGVEQLRGVFGQRRELCGRPFDPGYDEAIEAELSARGVRYEIRRQFSNRTDLLERYADQLGVVVSFKAGTPTMGCHSVVVTSFDPEWVEFYDSNRPKDSQGKPKTWRCGRAWFDSWWLGSSVVIFPN